jgi:GNAT superfamily N-acetyltransferase
LLPAIGGLWGDVFAQPPYSVTREQVAGFPAVLARQTERPGFACVAAVREGDAALLGFAYGAVTDPGPPAGAWHGTVCAAVGPAATTRIRGAFELAELAVHKSARRHGLGERLVAALLAQTPVRCSWLVTLAGASDSRRFYDRLGWAQLATVTFPGRSDPFVILGWERPAREADGDAVAR